MKPIAWRLLLLGLLGGTVLAVAVLTGAPFPPTYPELGQTELREVGVLPLRPALSYFDERPEISRFRAVQIASSKRWTESVLGVSLGVDFVAEADGFRPVWVVSFVPPANIALPSGLSSARLPYSTNGSQESQPRWRTVASARWVIIDAVTGDVLEDRLRSHMVPVE